ncbi:MAG: questin oxidase family protein [Bermanella sp.]
MTIINTPLQGTHFKPSKDMSTLVNGVLKKDSAFHPNLGGITKGGMSNHYPMTILSLQGLGASDEEIQHFTDMWPRHRAHLTQQLNLKDNQVLNEKNWHEYLGQANFLLEFRRVFLTQLQNHESPNKYVANILYQIRNALPMGLFHPLIRISFAMIHGDKGLIADGLAYMAIRFTDLYGGADFSVIANEKLKKEKINKDIGESATQNNAMNTWKNVHEYIETQGQNIHFSQTIQGGSLHICEQLCSEPAIQTLAFENGLNINPENLLQSVAEISMCALRLYLHQPALTTLHAVTACQALADITKRCLEEHTDSKQLIALWQCYWMWLSGLYIEKGYPKDLPKIDTKLETEIASQEWKNLAIAARGIPEVHLIKMVYSCKWLFENIEQSVYYKLAVVKILKERNAHPRSPYGLTRS